MFVCFSVYMTLYYTIKYIYSYMSIFLYSILDPLGPWAQARAQGRRGGWVGGGLIHSYTSLYILYIYPLYVHLNLKGTRHLCKDLPLWELEWNMTFVPILDSS